MKIKHILTLFCVTLTLAFLLVSCAASSEGSKETAANQSNLEWINSITVADVSKENCEHADLSLNCFISVWNTEHGPSVPAITGVSEAKIVKLPLVKGGTYDFYVDWGDGEDVEKIEAYDAPAVTHTYKDGGEKTIHIAGTIKGWRFFTADNSYGDASKLTGVTQWGSLSLGNTDGRQFQGAENFNPTATDAPDLSETTSLVSAFAAAIDFNGAIGNWDVSKVTDMSFMFNGARSFNNNGMGLDWDDKTSNVTNMNNMFNLASDFNQDISEWDVSKVTDMSFMFSGARSFNNNGKPLDWDDKTSNVTNMNNMFNLASDFNQNISGWKVEKVADYDDFAADSALVTNHTPPKFRGANAVSKEVCEAKPELNCFISVWNTGKSGTGASAGSTIVLPLVNNGEYNFYVDWGDGEDVEKIEAYNADKITHTYATQGEYTVHITGTIKGWRFHANFDILGDAVKLLNVTQWGSLSLGNTAGRQFEGAANFNPTATDALDVSETTDLSSAFTGASSFNADISDWDVSQVTTMKGMFWDAKNFNNNGKPLDWGIKTSKVTDMQGMFLNASAFNQNISSWNVSEVIDMDNMFLNASVFNQNISGWKVEKVAQYDDFATGSGLIPDHTPPKFRDPSTVSEQNCASNPLINCFISVWNTEKSGNGASDSNKIVLPLVSEGTYDFYVDWGDGEDVEKIEAYNADKITHTYATQGEYTIHIAGTIKGWRFFVANNSYGDAVKLLNVTQWGSLSLGKTVGAQFKYAENFNPTATDAPDLSETTSLSSAFSRASSFNGTIGNWDVSKVTKMNNMFYLATSFNNNGKGLDWGQKTSKVTDMEGMFNEAKAFNQDISGWNVSEVTDMTDMFRDASDFNQDISKWNVAKVADSAGFATGSGIENKSEYQPAFKPQ